MSSLLIIIHDGIERTIIYLMNWNFYLICVLQHVKIEQGRKYINNPAKWNQKSDLFSVVAVVAVINTEKKMKSTVIWKVLFDLILFCCVITSSHADKLGESQYFFIFSSIFFLFVVCPVFICDKAFQLNWIKSILSIYFYTKMAQCL